MPLYYYSCDLCKVEQRKIFKPVEVLDSLGICKVVDCSGTLRRSPRGAKAFVVERLDNGHMSRYVERPADAERLYKERADKATRGE